MIGFEHLCAGYGPCDVLQSVSAEAKPGEFIALIGPDGCGTSTLLKTLCAVIRPYNGR
jgi:ABC-type cobalamin/Fe3+-siderophores transport system ATPase subunit